MLSELDFMISSLLLIQVARKRSRHQSFIGSHKVWDSFGQVLRDLIGHGQILENYQLKSFQPSRLV